jgi:hypothetical protein
MAPSPEFVAALPNGKIPDRDDFYGIGNDERIRAWRRVVAERERLADALRELVSRRRGPVVLTTRGV